MVILNCVEDILFHIKWFLQILLGTPSSPVGSEWVKLVIGVLNYFISLLILQKNNQELLVK